MRILGIDTAIPTASVALVEDGELVGEEIHSRDSAAAPEVNGRPVGNHAEVVLPLLQALFQKIDVTVQQLSGIGISIGPGSFTGLRIGLATAKGIAYEPRLPLLAVSTLQANAARANFRGNIASILDARKREVYLALFRRAESRTLVRLTPDRVMSLNAAIDLIQQYAAKDSAMLVVANGAEAYENRLRECLGDAIRISCGKCYGSIAAQVALLAEERFAAHCAADAGELIPVYLRFSEAESKIKI
jgi:tRNA threonylcarbamoyladenosine biosynthesis protein TsaB